MSRWTFSIRRYDCQGTSAIKDAVYCDIMAHAPSDFDDHVTVNRAADCAIADIVCGRCDARGWSPRACVRNRAMDLLWEWHTGVRAHERKTRRVSA